MRIAAMAALFCGCLWGTLAAQTGTAGNTGLAFLKIGVGGRGAALGDAITADVAGAAAAYWNPAGLIGAGSQAFFAHARLFQDVNNEYFALGFPALGASWAFSLQVQNTGGIMERQVPSAEPISEISAHDFALGLSFARSVSPALQIGVTAKYIGQQIFGYSTRGGAFDFGLQYHPAGMPGFAIAASVHNLGRMQPLRVERPKLPGLLRIGVAYAPAFSIAGAGIKLLASGQQIFDADLVYSFASEIKLQDKYAIRLGYKAANEVQDFSGGFGLYLARYQLDYAYVPFSLGLGDSHRFSISIRL